ncbi:UDP-4-amino-4,6-dideoxy-N-acetyl-beta-L-altrosamine transaminase [archaeon]|nr:UDP-4-amino-4,6-dideoxy-N-acetyl-beta-L-altrosamine transaminase [archaeon]
MVPADQDSRDYNVNFDKITNVLGYTADYSIEAGSREIKEKILDNTIKDTEDTKYYSIKTIKNLLDTPANVTGKTIRSDFLPFALPTISENEEKEVIDTLRSGWITTGPKTKLFEEKIRRYTGIKNVVALNSCTGALHLALAALDIKQGDEVITTPITWPSTASMIIHVGAKPVFVDINRETLNIDVTKIEEKITEKTKAIIPVDLSGQPCQMDEIMEIAKKHNLKVISDSAHSIGAQYKGRNVGTIADITCFSFYTIKNITTGEGGALLTNDDAIAEKVRILSLHGLSADAWKRYDKEVPTWNLLQPGFKYNMLDLQAAIGLHQIDKLDSFIKTRESYTNIYEKEFENLDGIILPKSIDNIKHAKHLFQLVLDTDELKIDRAEFMEAMKKENIGTGIHFHSLVGTDYYAKTYGYKEEDFPNATFIGKRLVSIPLYPKMTTDDLRNVIDAVKKIIKYYKK